MLVSEKNWLWTHDCNAMQVLNVKQLNSSLFVYSRPIVQKFNAYSAHMEQTESKIISSFDDMIQLQHR